MEEPVNRRRGTGRDWTPLAVFLAVVVVGSMGVKMLLDRLTDAPRQVRQQLMEGAQETARRVREVFQVVPEVRVREVIIQGQSAPIAELSVLEREYEVEYLWTHQWLHSTKQIRLTGTWRAKAGFDLYKPFRIRLDPETGRVFGEFPEAEVLSLEMVRGPEIKGESGWWNRLNDQDRSQALQGFAIRAREVVEASGLTGEAQDVAAARLQQLADRQTGRTHFEFRFRARSAEGSK